MKAIDALKQKVLSLAIQGKLVAQDPTDEPASVLLEKIKAEKAELVKQGKIKKDKQESYIFRGDDNKYYEKIGSETKDITDEIPFEIPNSWSWVRLGNVFNVILGQSPDGNSVNETNGIEFHQGKVFFSDKYLNKSNQYTTKPSKLVQKDTVLLCVRAPVGVVNITQRDICIGRGLAGIDNIAGMSSDFVYYWLQALKNDFISKATGTTFIAITGDVIQNQLIPLPPLSEQKRIVEEIEKIFGQIEVVKENQEELNKLKDGLKNKVLDLAIQGKLVEQDPNDEPASVLLEKIKEEKAELIKQGKIKKDKQESYIYKGADNRHYEKIGSEVRDINEEIPFEIPNSWSWTRMVDITKQIHYGYTASAKSDGTAKLLRITDIQNNSVCWNNVPFCDISEKELSSYQLYLRDILIARTGGTVGKSYIIDELKSLSVFASYLIRLIPVVNINEYYIKIFLESPMYWKQLKSKSMGTGQPNVNGEALKSLLIPIPPIEEQKRIVEKLENVFHFIKTL